MPTLIIEAFDSATTPLGDFQKALAAVLRSDIEGGFVDNPKDPGGATNMGISLREVQRLDAGKHLSAYLKEFFDIDHDGDIDAVDVKGWTRDHAETFYRTYYWEPIKGAQLPFPVSMIVFDSAVNEGVPKAAMHLQRSLGGVMVDGIIGPATVAAVWKWKIPEGGLRPEEEVFLSRLNRYASLKDAPDFFAGWSRRSFKILKVSQS